MCEKKQTLEANVVCRTKEGLKPDPASCTSIPEFFIEETYRMGHK